MSSKLFIKRVMHNGYSKICSKHWYTKDYKLHREDGPACISYNLDTGTIDNISWYKNSRLHRIDGPAFVHFYDSGFEIAWYENGILLQYISYNNDTHKYKTCVLGSRMIQTEEYIF